jgi:hypothetical protein
MKKASRVRLAFGIHLLSSGPSFAPALREAETASDESPEGSRDHAGEQGKEGFHGVET